MQHLTVQAVTYGHVILQFKPDPFEFDKDTAVSTHMAGVAKRLRPRIVVPVRAGSNPVVCPITP
jgi:hypothetical protein